MPAAKRRKTQPELFLPTNRTLFNGRVASDQQEVVFKWVEDGEGNLVLIAVAGSGKTTTLVQMTTLMRGSIALAAYNKAIQVEIAAKLTEIGSSARAGTFHSFGFSAIRRQYPKVKVDAKKVENLIDEMGVDPKLRAFVQALVSHAKARAFGVLESIDNVQAWVRIVDHFMLEDKLSSEPGLYSPEEMAALVFSGINEAILVLNASNKRWQTIIDFDDMIYIPLVCNLNIYKNDWVLVDEAQDTNPCRREFAGRMLAPGGRIVFVGDPHQAIYGFTGADNDSLAQIVEKFKAATLPLDVTYRCPKAVVEMARQYVSHITAHESSPEGEVLTIKDAEFHAMTDFTVNDVILCRNTKPLVETAFSLIRRGIGCHVEGRDIGQGLIALATKWKTVKTTSALRDRLGDWLDKEVEKLSKKKQDARIDALTDRVETLYVIIDALPQGKTQVYDVVASINGIFGDTKDGERSRNLTLSTVHKAKGREWDRVFLWGRSVYMPSWFAKQPWQQEQEVNLIYVAVTRAKQTLVEVEVPKPAPSKRRGAA